MITRKNISKSYLSKKKRNRNRNDRVKQSGGAAFSNDLIAERLNFFKEFADEAAAAEAIIVNNAVASSKQDKVTIFKEFSGLEALPIPDIERTTITEENTILTYVNLHGCLNGNVEQVPTNTIICFLSPIEEIFYINDNEPNSFTTFIHNLTLEQFKEIVTKREQLNNTIEQKKQGLTDGYAIYNCFKNSTWYYPGDIFPDIKLEIYRTDFENMTDELREKSFPYIYEVVDIKNDSKSLKYSHNSSFFIELLGLTNKDYFSNPDNEDTLSNNYFQNTLLTLITDKCRIIITSACRNFNIAGSETGDQSDIDIQLNLRIELYYQTLNKQNVAAIDSSTAPISDNFLPQCHSGKKYYYLPESDIVTYGDLAYFDKFKQSYRGKVNSLMHLKDKFIDNDEKFEEIDYAYLCSFTLTQIIMFLSLPEISPITEKYKQHWFELLTISKAGYPELINRINSMCDFFNSNAGIARILYIYTGYQPIDDAITNLNSLIPILMEYEKDIYTELGLLEKVLIVKLFIPDNEKAFIDIKTHDKYYSDNQESTQSVKDLTIFRRYDIIDLSYYPLIETLNIMAGYSPIIKFINLYSDYYNYSVKTINIFTNQFIMNNRDDVFIRFKTLQDIYISIDGNLENCYIHNNNVISITIEGNNNYINNFEFKTPSVASIMFNSIYFKNKYHFDRFLSNLKIETGNLTYLCFKYCAFADGTMFDTREYLGSIGSDNIGIGSDHNPMYDPGKLELTSSLFKKMGKLDSLVFVECSFYVSYTEKPQILKTLLEEMKHEKNLEYIYTIKLDLDSSEGPLFVEDIVPITISNDTELLSIYNNLKTTKEYYPYLDY